MLCHDTSSSLDSCKFMINDEKYSDLQENLNFSYVAWNSGNPCQMTPLAPIKNDILRTGCHSSCDCKNIDNNIF